MPEPIDLAHRVAAIEARQRAYAMHDPDCQEFDRIQAHRGSLMYFHPRECTCWLASDIGSLSEASDAEAIGRGSVQ